MEVVFAGLSVPLFINTILPEPMIWAICALAAAQAGMFALQRPSLDALIPRLVDSSDLMAARALNATRGTLGMLLGPAIGGLRIVSVGLPGSVPVSVVSGGVLCVLGCVVCFVLLRISRL